MSQPAFDVEADRLDAAYRRAGFVGPLHGIPVMLKDQIDAAGMPTTLGSVLFKDLPFAKALFEGTGDTSRHYVYLVSRDEIMHRFLKVMADHAGDAPPPCAEHDTGAL